MAEKLKPIETFEELMEALRKEAEVTEVISGNDWENHIKASYADNTPGDVIMTDFKYAKLLGMGRDHFDAFRQVDRLRSSAVMTKDPVKACVMLAAAVCAEEHYQEVLEASASAAFYSFLPDVKARGYTVDPKAEEKLKRLNDEAGRKAADDRNAAGRTPEENTARLKTMSFSELDITERTAIVSSHCDAFYSSKAMMGDFNTAYESTKSQKEYFDKVHALAEEYLHAVLYPNTVRTIPKGVTAEQLRSICEKNANLPYPDRERLLKSELPKYKDITFLRENAPGVEAGSASLSLENGLFDNVNSKDFLEHSKAGTLSYVELEWARGAVDNMFRAAYRNEILADLERMGKDPAQQLYINGERLTDMTISPDSDTTWRDILMTRELTVEESARMKAAAVTAVLEGKKLDMRCYEMDPLSKRAELSENIISVKTDSHIKSGEKFSLIRWFKQLLGLEPKSTEKLIEQANKSHADTHKKIAMSFNELAGQEMQVIKPPAQKSAPSKEMAKSGK